jgi:hypothetical protein
MQVVPLSVGRVARSWDEQHLDVGAAARQLGAAPTGGFTEALAGASARFASTWQRHVAALADQAEARADGLRSALADYLRTDEAVAQDQIALRGFLHEIR